MREGNRRRPGLRWALVLLGALAALGLAPLAAAAPINDNYLSSLQLNAPGKQLNRTETLRDLRDTTGATVQSDVFNPTIPGGPPLGGGPPEATTCNGVGYGATVWYDFYPDISGLARIRTSGFDNVIAVVPFDAKSAVPDFAARRCVPNLSTMSQELIAPVTAGHAYTVQIGGVNAVQGRLEFLFDFLPQIRRVNADATLIAQALATGIRIKSLKVSAPRGTRVEVRCTRGCPPQAKSARTVSFSGLNGVRLAAGARLRIYVTEPSTIGAYIEYRIGRGSFTKISRCLNPGSRKPRLSCG